MKGGTFFRHTVVCAATLWIAGCIIPPVPDAALIADTPMHGIKQRALNASDFGDFRLATQGMGMRLHRLNGERGMDDRYVVEEWRLALDLLKSAASKAKSGWLLTEEETRKSKKVNERVIVHVYELTGVLTDHAPHSLREPYAAFFFEFKPAAADELHPWLEARDRSNTLRNSNR